MHPQENDHADDIVLATYEAPLPAKREFLPWHRPRKQFVRQYQWCEQIGRLLELVEVADGTLKYLGLPGIDLLDLRYFHSEICEKRNLALRFLGFNTDAKPTSLAHTELNVSLDEVRRLNRIDPLSDVIRDSFVLLGNEDSLACRRTRELGPYDVVNLDLCDGFGAHPATMTNSYYNAVASLLALQSRLKTPWLLLLTTRADRQNVDDGVLEALLRKYIENLANCEAFREGSREKFAIETEAALVTASGTPEGLLPVFLTSLCKWFLALALAHQPPTTVELCSVHGYRVTEGSGIEDLVSLALKFTPTFVPADDALGLAHQSTDLPNECALSAKALKRVAKRVNVDKILADDADLNNEMIDATATLLSLARYDVEAYRAWLQTA
jgi:hypothetical protein